MSAQEVLTSQRERLLDAMAESCAEKGYAQTTVADIVARAGVSRATFYQLFADKEACFLAAAETVLEQTQAAIAEQIDPERPWPETIADSIAALLAVMSERPNFARLALLEAPAAGRRSYDGHQRGVRDLVARLDRARAASKPGSQDPIPPSAGRAAVGGAEALIVDALLAGRPARLPELLPDIVYIALVPYLGQAEALREAEAARRRHDAPAGDPLNV